MDLSKPAAQAEIVWLRAYSVSGTLRLAAFVFPNGLKR